ncbi:MAG: transglycosylase SLT domain-containing protein [Chloroflexota bacterium]|nr:transglycosylase SLT domain-containing protein [Chloroflexota bacterium]
MPFVSPRARSVRRPGGFTVLAGVLALAIAAAVLPAPAAVLAAPATQDLTIFAGPGEEYDALAYAPAGSELSLDGEAVNGFYPVSYNGTSGWAATWAVGTDAAPVPEWTPEESAWTPEAEWAPEGGWTADASWTPESAWVPEAMAAPTVEDAAPVEDEAASTGGGDVTQIITDAALRFGQNPEDMLRVATCESGLDPGAVGSGLYYGLFQFVPSTFAGTPYGDQNIYDPYANANAAAWMWSQGRRGEWVCQ